jgi:hypothetical protein
MTHGYFSILVVIYLFSFKYFSNEFFQTYLFNNDQRINYSTMQLIIISLLLHF